MLQVPQSSKISVLTTQPSSETRLSRIIRAYEEAIEENHALDEFDRTSNALFSTLYDITDALTEEASYQLPSNEREAVFLLMLAGTKTDVIADGARRKAQRDAAKSQSALIAAALSYFAAKHRVNFPASWDHVVFPIQRSKTEEGK